MGLAAFPLVIAAIYQAAGNNYIPNVEVFFIACGWVGVMIGLYLNYYDYYHINSILNGVNQRRPSMEELEKHHRSLVNPIHDDEEDGKEKLYGAESTFVSGNSRASRVSNSSNSGRGRELSTEEFYSDLH